MVERSLSMREVPGSIPGFSTLTFFFRDLCNFFFLTDMLVKSDAVLAILALKFPNQPFIIG